MGPHPVPQNVTSFQFKLVGDMTLKQFLYLAGGAGSAYLIFVFFSTSYPLISWPLIFILILLGASFAFMPIASRPLDHWVKAFFKAIYSQTRFSWSKDNIPYKETSRFNSRYIDFIRKIELNKKQPSVAPGVLKTQPVEATALPSSEDLKKTVDLAKEAQQLQIKIVQTERTLNQIKAAASQPSPIPINYSDEVNRVLENLQTLVNQASEIKARMQPETGQKLETKQFKDQVKVIIPEKQKQTQIALTTFPNVISGIVKTGNGDFLESVVAVIYDKEGLPVRALKTNKLGQFSGSTPLPNGTYTLELEKDNYSFDVLQILLDGNLLGSLTITAKEMPPL